MSEEFRLNLEKNKKILVGFALLMGLIVPSILVGGLVTKTSSVPTVVVLYDETDIITTKAVSVLIDAGLGALNTRVIGISSGEELISTIISARADSVFYVFHGTRIGWTVGRDFVTADRIKNAIEQSQPSIHIADACYSSTIMQAIENKIAHGIIGKVDYAVASVLAVDMFLDVASEDNIAFRNAAVQLLEAREMRQAFIETNAMSLFLRFMSPKETLWPYGGPKIIITQYDSSYIGPTGFYSVSQVPTSEPQTLSIEVQSIIKLMSTIKNLKVGITFSYSIAAYVITGTAVYSWSTTTTTTTSIITTWYSKSDRVQFVGYKVSFSIDGQVSAIKNSADKASGLSGSASKVKVSVVASQGTPEFFAGGKFYYNTIVYYTDSPRDQDLAQVVNEWNSVHNPLGWTVNAYLQVQWTWAFSIKVEGFGKSYSKNFASISVGGRIEFFLDSSGAVKIDGALFAKVDSKLIDGLGIEVKAKAVAIALGIRAEKIGSSSWGKVIYSGIYVYAAGKIAGNGFTYENAHAYAWANELGYNVKSLVTTMAKSV